MRVCVCPAAQPSGLLLLPLVVYVLTFVYQKCLKGEDEPQTSKTNQPGKKRKNNKKNQSRKRTNAPPDKEVCAGTKCIHKSTEGWVHVSHFDCTEQHHRFLTKHLPVI